MEPRTIFLTVMVLHISHLITASPTSHLRWIEDWSPYTFTGKETCDGTSTTNICGDDCKSVLFCPSGITASTCAGAVPHCHQPASGEAKCSVAGRCHGAPLKCMEDGAFPNPYYCTMYHQCTAGVDSDPIDCKDAAYNIDSGFCDLPLDAPVCLQGPVPECTSLVQRGALPDNKQYYYRCRRDNNAFLYYPEMLKCPDGQHFDENSGGLGSCHVVTTTALPTETTTVATPPTGTETTPTETETTPTDTETTPTETETTPTETETTPTETETTPTDTETTPTETKTTPTETETTPTETETTPTVTETTPTETETTPTETKTTPTETETTPPATETTPTETETTPTETETTPTETETTPTETETTPTQPETTPTEAETTTTEPETTPTEPETTPTDAETTPTEPETTPTKTETTPTETMTTPTETNTTPTSTDPTTTVAPPKDNTVTIVVGSVVAGVFIIGGSIAGYFYMRKRKMKTPENRKLF